MNATAENVHTAPPLASEFRSRVGQRFTIRPCAELAEVDQCVDLQQQTWGYPDREVVPRNLYVLAQALGGHVLSAWSEQGTLAGFAMAVAAHEPPGSDTGSWMQPIGFPAPAVQQTAPPTPYLHSHMLAIAGDFQNTGLGYALKLAQREDALRRGIATMRWTFDPLMVRNASFNLRRIGALSRRYISDFYGQLGSKLQGGLPTDRLLAEWDLRATTPRQGARPDEPPGEILRRIELPASIVRWRTQGARSELLETQARLRGEFGDAFAQGMELRGFRLLPDGHGEYLLCAGSRMG